MKGIRYIKGWFIGLWLAPLMLLAQPLSSFPKSYYAIKDAKKQKERFVKILYPLIQQAVNTIKQERAFVVTFFDRLAKGEVVTPSQQARLRHLAKTYRIQNIYDKEAYLKRIDTIPISLVLAQASIESNWGKSRFAREANNLFGEWTWGSKGIVPREREAGKSHKIRIFDSLEASIASYMRNLNRHNAYASFREARYLARKQHKPFNGFHAASYLIKYSELREKYIQMLKRTIASNDWSLYDEGAVVSAQNAKETALLTLRQQVAF